MRRAEDLVEEHVVLAFVRRRAGASSCRARKVRVRGLPNTAAAR